MYGISKAPELVVGRGVPNLGIGDDRGFFRLFIQGLGFLVLGFFMGVSKYVETKKMKWLFLFIGLFIVIVLHLTRHMIVFALLITLFYLLKNITKTKYLWICIGITAVLLNTGKIEIADDSVVGRLIFLSENQLEEHNSGNENTRVSEYKFFFTKYSENIFTNIFGNGIPHKDSSLGKREAQIRKMQGVFTEDVGYATLYVRIGLIGLVFYALIFYRTVRQKIPIKYMYVKLYMAFIISANIMASWVYDEAISISVCLYILNNYRQNSYVGHAGFNRLSKIAL
jgi:hypothetical protein